MMSGITTTNSLDTNNNIWGIMGCLILFNFMETLVNNSWYGRQPPIIRVNFQCPSLVERDEALPPSKDAIENARSARQGLHRGS